MPGGARPRAVRPDKLGLWSTQSHSRQTPPLECALLLDVFDLPAVFSETVQSSLHLSGSIDIELDDLVLVFCRFGLRGRVVRTGDSGGAWPGATVGPAATGSRLSVAVRSWVGRVAVVPSGQP